MPRFARFIMSVAVALSCLTVASPAFAQSAPADVTVLSANTRWPGKVFVNHDEWTFRDDVYTEDAAQLARNIAAWFTKGRPGTFLAYSTNRALTGLNLERTMVEAGHTWSVDTTLDLSLATLRQYDAVFLSGDPADNAALVDYVRAGGNVYVAGGTGWGGPVAEAERWNPFLDAFGLKFAPEYNVVAVGRSLAIQSSSPLFQNVHGLYQFFGSSISVTNTLGGDTTLLFSAEGHGLYAAYDSPAIAVAADFTPTSCQNTLDVRAGGIVKTALLSTVTFDARRIDPASVRLFGVAPTQSSVSDVARPVTPLLGRTVPGCSTGNDGRADLVLSFENSRLVAAIKQGLGRDPQDGEAIALIVTGRLKSQYGGTPVVGEDVVVIKDQGLIETVVGVVGGVLGGLLGGR